MSCQDCQLRIERLFFVTKMLELSDQSKGVAWLKTHARNDSLAEFDFQVRVNTPAVFLCAHSSTSAPPASCSSLQCSRQGEFIVFFELT